MTDRLHITLDGLPVAKCDVYEPQISVWWASVVLVDAPSRTPAGVLRIGDAEWRGTLVDAQQFGAQWHARLIGGANGWASLIVADAEHNDAGVKADSIIRKLARQCGETLGTVQPSQARLGNDYARQAGPASRILENAIRGAQWWVARDGITHIGKRTAGQLTADVLDHDPKQRRLTVVVDDLRTITVATTISDPRLPTPFIVGSLDIHATSDGIKCTCWADVARDPIADALEAIAVQATRRRLDGIYRYRVVQMQQKRVDLQAVKKAAGLPDLRFIDQWPGISGAHADLQPGGEVLVQFIDGDPSDPVITGYAGAHKADPVRLELGSEPHAAAARQGDAVEVLLPPAIFSGTIGGTPASGVLTFPLMKMAGTITGGSVKVKIGG